MIRVLIVDDSPSARELLAYVLGSDPGLEVAGCASDGAQAVQMARDLRPDVITMDLQMPGTDGVEATRSIMQACPVPIVIVSGSNRFEEVGASFRAIEAGALVALQRPSGIGSPDHLASANALIRTVKSMAEVKVVRRWSAAASGSAVRRSTQLTRAPQLVLIGASTGGPAVLRDILAELPAAFPLPVVIVQHMSPGFEAGFANWLGAASGFPVSVAVHGEALMAGRAYIVPNKLQPAITRERTIALAEGPSEHGMCPAVSHLFRSVHPDLCGSCIAVLLTGMGKDGAAELRGLKDKGAVTIVQDRASSAVFGMPGEAIRQDAAKHVLAPAEIGILISTLGAASSMPPAPAGTGSEA